MPDDQVVVARRRLPVLSLQNLSVGPVDTDLVYADEHLAGLRLRLRNVCYPSAAGLSRRDDGCFHRPGCFSALGSAEPWTSALCSSTAVLMKARWLNA